MYTIYKNTIYTTATAILLEKQLCIFFTPNDSSH